MTNVEEGPFESDSSDGAVKFDLEERTALFGGANCCEADDAGSGKEFRHRISLCRRESRESKHRLRMIAAAVEDRGDLVTEARTPWQEAKELNLIFAAIFRNTTATKT